MRPMQELSYRQRALVEQLVEASNRREAAVATADRCYEEAVSTAFEIYEESR